MRFYCEFVWLSICGPETNTPNSMRFFSKKAHNCGMIVEFFFHQSPSLVRVDIHFDLRLPSETLPNITYIWKMSTCFLAIKKMCYMIIIFKASLESL